jgi:tetratricopeptide (TPR) repeat protein
MGWIFGCLGTLSFAAMALNWRRISGSDPLIWVAFLYLALSAQRNVALFAIAAAPIAIRNLNEWLDARSSADAASPAGSWRWAATGLTSAALLVCSVGAVNGELFLRSGLSRSFGFGVMEVFYPMGAAEWIARERPPGRILHHMADGGYLIWRLYPDYPVMVDGRLEVFGDERFIELQVPGLARFRALDEEYRFGSVLIHYSLIPSSELMWWLYLNTNWQFSYLDDVAAVFTRVPEGSPPGDIVDLDAPDLFPPLEGNGAVDRMQRFARTNFWTSMRRWKRALALWEETRELYPDLEQGPIIHAMLLDRNGLQAASEAILRELSAERPDDAELLAHVGDLRLGAGDLDAARELYEAALTLEPNQVHSLARRAQVAESDGDPALAADLYLRVMGLSNPAAPLAITARSRLMALGGVSTGGR